MKTARIVANATTPSRGQFPVLRAVFHTPGRGCRKAVPGIPGMVLQEPNSFHQKAIRFLQEVLALRICAGNSEFQRFAVIQTEHTHEAGSVDLEAFISHRDEEGLLRGQRHKVLHIPEREEAYMEFPHKIPPNAVQIYGFRV